MRIIVAEELGLMSKRKIILYGFYARLTEIISRFFEKNNFGSEIKVKPSQKKLIQNIFKEGNEKLKNEFKINL